ncbi:hypothetical protein NM688_g3269 [Phlebia brevispora]|uniref:Uncharacterized protein n=1 Tax=Phlebia brevispora TaxID=194682 RepID=A0ACC1T6F3_9APHY|nr:hypothetical protein NM688_g3269 [Phlebia brevispora]
MPSSNELQDVSAIWGMFGLPTVGGMLGSLVVFLGKWVADHRAYPRLEEAIKVVAEIDSTMNNIQPHTLNMITFQNGVTHFADLQTRRQNIHYDLDLLQERVLRARSTELMNIWGKLITDLDQFILQAKDLQADVLSTTNRATTEYRNTMQHRQNSVVSNASQYFIPADMLPAVPPIAASAEVTAARAYELGEIARQRAQPP